MSEKWVYKESEYTSQGAGSTQLASNSQPDSCEHLYVENLGLFTS